MGRNCSLGRRRNTGLPYRRRPRNPVHCRRRHRRPGGRRGIFRLQKVPGQIQTWG